MTEQSIWYQVRGPGFMAGVQVVAGRVEKAGKLLQTFVGQDVGALMAWCQRQNCTVLELTALGWRIIVGKE